MSRNVMYSQIVRQSVIESQLTPLNTRKEAFLRRSDNDQTLSFILRRQRQILTYGGAAIWYDRFDVLV